ncbi:hypothetical protein ABZX30_28430 [Streptomyces sp. NPDC004542]|uniref:hypothetical protein n=1 Tax=Streptomyces sp. NPDC004542 TaxID=3154281 RepID=UPI0033A5DDDF
MTEPNVTPPEERSNCGDTGRLERFPCVLGAEHTGTHRDSLGASWGGSAQPRYMGRDTFGKSVFVSPAPGGVLERITDRDDVESGHVLAALVRSILDGETPPKDEELAAFVPLLTRVFELDGGAVVMGGLAGHAA